MNPIRSVTIDLDGTLLDTVPDLAAASGMMRELGRPEFPLDVVASFVGRGIPKLVDRYLPDGSRAGGNGALIEALAACAREAGREVASPAEAREMLGLTPISDHSA